MKWKRAILRNAVRIVPWPLRDRVKQLPIVGPVQRWIVSTQLFGEAFVHRVDAGPAKGMKFEIVLPEDKGIWTGAYESEFARYVGSSVEPGCVGYDVGAWHGFFAGVMLAQGAREVIMFEPLPTNINRLTRFIGLNPEHRISLQRFALGAERGTTTLVQMEGTSMSKIAASPFQSDRPQSGELEVAIETLDALISANGLPLPDLMKIDIEGAELMMLNGAQETLAQARPTIFAEVHSGELLEGVTSLLRRHDYVVEQLETSEVAAREADAAQIRAKPRARA